LFIDTDEIDEGPCLLTLDQNPQVADGVATVVDDAPEIVARAGHAIGKQLLELARRRLSALLHRETAHVGCLAGIVLEDSPPKALVFALCHRSQRDCCGHVSPAPIIL
jgi:hypothetical protein